MPCCAHLFHSKAQRKVDVDLASASMVIAEDGIEQFVKENVRGTV